jgi:hypothetical protein
VQYDGAAWKQQSINEAGNYQFEHSSKAAYIKVISEPAQVPFEKTADIALRNARAVDANAKEVRRGSRLVNGVRMAFSEYEATVNNIAVVFYGHYYSDDAGTIQVLGWSTRDLIDSYRDKIDGFVSGFQIRRGR